MRGRPGVFLVGLAVVLFAMLVIIGNREFDDEPFGPNSTSPDGALALVQLLERYGSVDVVLDAPSDHDTAILLKEANRADLAPLRSWIQGGGTLVVADPGSELVPDDLNPEGSGEPGVVQRGDCLNSRLSRVDALFFEFDQRRFVGASGCFGQHPRVVQSAIGQGRLVVVIDQSPFVNAFLGEADNAVFAVDLLIQEEGGRVAFVRTQPMLASGDQSLGDLISDNVRVGIWFLVAALVAFALYRARRLGRPVLETPLVEIPGSELVRATGNLYERIAATNDAAALLRASSRRHAALRSGLSPELSPLVLANTLATSLPFDEAWLEWLFVDRNTTEADLVALTDRAAQLRAALHRQLTPTPEER